MNSHPWVNVIIPDAENRHKDDFHVTPPEGTRALLSVEEFEGSIWEPACGDGAISKVLKDAGYLVFSTDLVDRGFGSGGIDFLLPMHQRADNIITNPPFKHMQEFVELGLERSRHKLALLARLAFLEGMKRKPMFESTPLARVWVFSKRLAIPRAGYDTSVKQNGMIAFAWFVWDHSHEGPPTLGWILPS